MRHRPEASKALSRVLLILAAAATLGLPQGTAASAYQDSRHTTCGDACRGVLRDLQNSPVFGCAVASDTGGRRVDTRRVRVVTDPAIQDSILSDGKLALVAEAPGTRLPVRYLGFTPGDRSLFYVFNTFPLTRSHESIAETVLHESLHLTTGLRSKIGGRVVVTGPEDKAVRAYSEACFASVNRPFPAPWG